MNVLKPHLQTTIWTLLKGGATQREIERITGISRHTIRTYQQRLAVDPANCPGVATDPPSQTAPPWPPTFRPVSLPLATSKCEPHRDFIDAQLRLGRNATAIYQDLVDLHGFDGAYNSVNRIVIAGRDSAQDSINQVGQEITRRNMDIQPTLTIRPGLPVRVIVNRDLVLRPYQPLFFNRGASQ